MTAKYRVRSKETSDRYRAWRKQNPEIDSLFHKEKIKNWEYWYLSKNDFPYDLLAEKHDLLIPKRLFGELGDATEKELGELALIKKQLSPIYEVFLETSVDLSRSIKRHYHLHCIFFKDKIGQ